MKIEITGNRCIKCNEYTQYYQLSAENEIESIDCGFCEKRQCKTRPGNRCKYYEKRKEIPWYLRQSTN